MIQAHLSGGPNRRVLSFDDIELFYEFEGDVIPGEVEDGDAAVAALIYFAMATKRPLHVAAPVSSVLLEGIEEFQRAWHRMCPDLFNIVDVTADEELAPRQPPNTGVLAYSGGVDANAALVFQMRHAGRRARDIQAAVQIHGLDVRLDEDMSGANAVARRTLAAFDIPLTVVRTNWRTLMEHWEMTHISALTSVLHQFDVGYGILASDEDYGGLVLPWSSNPVTNHLLSGHRVIQSDGGGLTRNEKVKMLSAFPEITEGLRVCWQDFSPDRLNCGRCEKCLRTKMNFAAWGQASPECLGDQIAASDMRGLKAGNRIQLLYLEQIHETAVRQGQDAPWVAALRRVILRSRARQGLSTVKAGVKRMMR